MADRGGSERTSGDEEERSTVRRDEGFYRALFEVNPAIKLLIDPPTFRIIDANQAAVGFYGWPREVLRQMRITDINVLTADEVQAEMENARVGRRRYFRFRHRIASGDVRQVEVHSGPVEVEGRELLLSIIHDVTDRDVLEAQLREAQRLEAVGRVAGAVAHDFNNLLTVILASSEVIERGLPEGSALASRATDIAFAASRAAELTRELLTFSRRQVLRLETVRIDEVVRDLHGVLARLLEPRISVSLQVPSSLPTVQVDAAQMEQVVLNLALNARDAMPDGGTLTVRCGVVQIEEHDVKAIPSGRWVTLSVEDDGEGMGPEVRQRAFEPFFTTKAAGTGLGLASVYGIVRQCDGHVRIESEPGQGTTFTLYFPARVDVDTVTSPADAEPSASEQACRLLLVEDDPGVRWVLAEGLEWAGHVVLQAGSVAEALALGDALDHIDALITDVVLPERSGIELAHLLLTRRPDLPVVVMSGDLRGHALASLPAHARALQKPFSVSALLTTLSEALSPSRR